MRSLDGVDEDDLYRLRKTSAGEKVLVPEQDISESSCSSSGSLSNSPNDENSNEGSASPSIETENHTTKKQDSQSTGKTQSVNSQSTTIE